MNKIEVKIKKLSSKAIVPTYGTEFSAGADIYAVVENSNNMIEIPSGETRFINTGFALEIPEGYVGLIYPRSGLSCKCGLALANKVGVIDSDYRGEVMIALHNHSKESRYITTTDRIAQLIVQPVRQINFIESEELLNTVRGDGGFGSTGSNV